MKRSLIILSILALFLTGFTTLAFAQSEGEADQVADSGQRSKKILGNINLTIPDDWKENKEEQNSSRVIVLNDQKSENKIEIYHREMLQETHASLLFAQFNTYLEENNVTSESGGEKTIELSDGNTRTGEYYIHKYTSNDITISVHSFMFVSGLHAYIAVGYFIKAEQDAGVEAFEKMLSNMIAESEN